MTFFSNILKELPPDLPNIINITDYSSSKISIVKVENAFATPNAFDFYKFLLPLTSEYPIEVMEDEKYRLKRNNLFPVNPGQFHCSETDNKPIIKIPPFLAIFVDKQFVQETGKVLFGKDKIFFENNNRFINPTLQNLINIFIEETVNKQAGYQLILENLNLQIAINLLRTLENNCTHELDIKNYSEKSPINDVINYLHKNYTEEFSLEEIASSVNYSPFHFIRIFKVATGKTPFEYLLDIKIKKAKEMLKNSTKSVTEICFSSGFNNRSHFSVVFKRKTGHSPSQYRKIVNG